MYLALFTPLARHFIELVTIVSGTPSWGAPSLICVSHCVTSTHYVISIDPLIYSLVVTILTLPITIHIQSTPPVSPSRDTFPDPRCCCHQDPQWKRRQRYRLCPDIKLAGACSNLLRETKSGLIPEGVPEDHGQLLLSSFRLPGNESALLSGTKRNVILLRPPACEVLKYLMYVGVIVSAGR